LRAVCGTNEGFPEGCGGSGQQVAAGPTPLALLKSQRRQAMKMDMVSPRKKMAMKGMEKMGKSPVKKMGGGPMMKSGAGYKAGGRVKKMRDGGKC
jgi:hypothetical protein